MASQSADKLAGRLRRSASRGGRRMFAVVAVFVVVACVVAGVYLTRRPAPPKTNASASAGYQAIVAAALKYAQALQTGQVQQAALHIAWVQDRLERVRAEKGLPSAENDALAAICQELTANDRSRAVVQEEGIEDQYLFVPRAAVEATGADGGRGGLERPTAGRAWLKLTYPDPATAPKDLTGRPIKSLTVGVNMSDDQSVLKAEIVGNLELDRYSIRYF